MIKISIPLLLKHLPKINKSINNPHKLLCHFTLPSRSMWKRSHGQECFFTVECLEAIFLNILVWPPDPGLHQSTPYLLQLWCNVFVMDLRRWQTQFIPSLMGMMTSSNGNIFHVTGLMWGETSGHRWFPLTKACDAELWWFLWSATQKTVEQTMESRWFDTPSHSLISTWTNV